MIIKSRCWLKTLSGQVMHSSFPRPFGYFFTRADINASEADVVATSANSPGGAGVVSLYAQNSLTHASSNDTIRPSYDSLYAINVSLPRRLPSGGTHEGRDA